MRLSLVAKRADRYHGIRRDSCRPQSIDARPALLSDLLIVGLGGSRWMLVSWVSLRHTWQFIIGDLHL